MDRLEFSQRAREAEAFFQMLYGDVEEGWLTIWCLKKKGNKEEKRTHWLNVAHGLDRAAAIAVGLADQGWNVYYGVGLRKEQGKPYQRGSEKDVLCIPGAWTDVDYGDSGHKMQDLPPTLDDAFQLVADFPAKPQIIVHSGNGLHVYWLFKEPWYIDSEETMNEAKQFMTGLQATLAEHARQRGWTYDTSAVDLARVLRVPGTFNYKGGERRDVVSSIRT